MFISAIFISVAHDEEDSAGGRPSRLPDRRQVSQKYARRSDQFALYPWVLPWIRELPLATPAAVPRGRPQSWTGAPAEIYASSASSTATNVLLCRDRMVREHVRYIPSSIFVGTLVSFGRLFDYGLSEIYRHFSARGSVS